MVCVNIAMLQEQVKTSILSISENIKFVKKEGLQLMFETPNDEDYATIIKGALKTNPNYKALYFTVTTI